MIVEEEKIELITFQNIECPNCKNSHNWKSIFMAENVKLIPIQEQKIAWCEKSNQFVLSKILDFHLQ